jgi:hypothetical protein
MVTVRDVVTGGMNGREMHPARRALADLGACEAAEVYDPVYEGQSTRTLKRIVR